MSRHTIKTDIDFSYPITQNVSHIWQDLRNNIELEDRCLYCEYSGITNSTACKSCTTPVIVKRQGLGRKSVKAGLYSRILQRTRGQAGNNTYRLNGYTDSVALHLQSDDDRQQLICSCPVLRKTYSAVAKVAQTDLDVMILGEKGTEKELMARAIHHGSSRYDGPFISFDCATVREQLAEAELFGFEQGVFADFSAAKPGKFELADGGTLFLDEIGYLTAQVQSRLMRVLESGIVQPIGARQGKKVDVRIISATDCSLQQRLDRRYFRGDLFFRLNTFTLKVPPLRERDEDKIILARYFFEKIASRSKKRPQGFSDQALDVIRIYSWPGNIREMIDTIRRAVIMAPGPWIEPDDLKTDFQSGRNSFIDH